MQNAPEDVMPQRASRRAARSPTPSVLQDASPAPEPTARPAPMPEYARISDVVNLYGVTRTRLYEEAGAGNIRMVKFGRQTLVDLASLRAFMQCLPEAKIRTPRRRPQDVA
jgi:hypothetical protein